MISCYIAMSIDGKIATLDGSVSWLDESNAAIENCNVYFASAYQNYITTVNTVVMGRKTYESISSFSGDYPYKHLDNYIITSTPENIPVKDFLKPVTLEEFISLNIPGKTWLVGGGVIVSKLLDLDVLDEIIITIIPVVLGSGLPLFNSHTLRKFTLTNSQVENSFVELSYSRKERNNV